MLDLHVRSATNPWYKKVEARNSISLINRFYDGAMLDLHETCNKPFSQSGDNGFITGPWWPYTRSATKFLEPLSTSLLNDPRLHGSCFQQYIIVYLIKRSWVVFSSQKAVAFIFFCFQILWDGIGFIHLDQNITKNQVSKRKKSQVPSTKTCHQLYYPLLFYTAIHFLRLQNWASKTQPLASQSNPLRDLHTRFTLSEETNLHWSGEKKLQIRPDSACPPPQAVLPGSYYWCLALCLSKHPFRLSNVSIPCPDSIAKFRSI